MIDIAHAEIHGGQIMVDSPAREQVRDSYLRKVTILAAEDCKDPVFFHCNFEDCTIKAPGRAFKGCQFFSAAKAPSNPYLSGKWLAGKFLNNGEWMGDNYYRWDHL